MVIFHSYVSLPGGTLVVSRPYRHSRRSNITIVVLQISPFLPSHSKEFQAAQPMLQQGATTTLGMNLNLFND